MRDEWFQGVEHLRGCVWGDNDTPAGSRDIGRIDVNRQAKERPREQALDPLQPVPDCSRSAVGRISLATDSADIGGTRYSPVTPSIPLRKN